MRLIISIFALFASFVACADYSEGYRMGVVTKFSSKGWVQKSWEGQLMMGREGSPLIVRSGDAKRTVNPWYFSAKPEKADKINQLAGEYVWVRYSEGYMNVGYDTNYLIEDIQPVTRATPTQACGYDQNSVGKSAGFRVGRIVKASLKGTVNKTYELTMQMGNSGNQFKNLSTTSKAVYDCAVQFLKSGVQVKVFYNESMFNMGIDSDTGYDIFRIEASKDL